MKGGGCAGRENGAGVFDGFRFAFKAAVWRRRERHGGGRKAVCRRQTAPAVDAVRAVRRARARKKFVIVFYGKVGCTALKTAMKICLRHGWLRPAIRSKQSVFNAAAVSFSRRRP